MTLTTKACKCGIEQWKYWDPVKGSPKIFCEVCDTEYLLYDLLEAYLTAHPDKTEEVQHDVND